MEFVIFIVVEVALIVGIGFLCFSMLASLRREAPYVPTGRKELQWILREVAKIKPGEVFYDLGSGDGRVVRAAARLGARAVGFEQSWVLTLWSRFFSVILRSRKATKESRALKNGIPRYVRDDICFVRGNYLNQNLSKANIVFCYLMPKAMEHLKPKFEAELRPGTRIISRAFKIPGWTPLQRLQFSPRRPPTYLYVR